MKQLTVREYRKQTNEQCDMLEAAGLGDNLIQICKEKPSHEHWEFGGFRVRQSDNVQHADDGVVILEVT